MVSLLGVALLLIGLGMIIYAQRITRVGEQIDAIGSTRSSFEVEPTDWNVAVTRILGAGVALLGFFRLISSLWPEY